ncbi:MAG: hypothetical protein J5515_05075 [Lachnospiraceae bacterium]|jgi:hypothetical protein|nr:hypothetical protein [Lachnospiraceae bacterium]
MFYKFKIKEDNVMGMEITTEATYSAYVATDPKAAKADGKKTDEVKKETASEAAVYEKSRPEKKATYSINKMSEEDRAKLVEQLKKDDEARQNQLLNIVNEMFGKQAKTFANATDMWRELASGNFEVDPETRAQAQKDISEDGYFGVKQTSQRLFDFACAIAGDDVEKMKEMQKAMQKGFDMAGGTWGRKLPDICYQTLDAANKMFDDYYKSHGVSE